jgi:hypothetical protein
METPLVEKEVLLEKIPGKGGWTFARLPEILQEKKTPFGWRKVRGFIDEYEIKSYHLMPMGNGQLFLPVKAEIRKAIKKKEGDLVKVILFADDLSIEAPEEFIECLSDAPTALENYNAITESERRKYLNWIYSSKTEDTKVERLTVAIHLLEKGLLLGDR